MDFGFGKLWEALGAAWIVDTVLNWLSANGALGLLLVVGLGMPVGLWLIHRSKIPVKIPGVQALKPVALVMMLTIYLAMVAMAGVILWREGSTHTITPSPPASYTAGGAPNATPGGGYDVSEPGGP